jgi:hypothetical protein
MEVCFVQFQSLFFGGVSMPTMNSRTSAGEAAALISACTWYDAISGQDRNLAVERVAA